MSLAIVVTNYNNVEHTENLVRNLSELRFPLDQVFIVDNRSQDSDLIKLRELMLNQPGLNVIFNSENLGYFRGLNVGIHAARSSGRFFSDILIGNNDILFEDEFFISLRSVRASWHDKLVVSPDIVTLDGVHQNPHVIESISPFRELVWDIYYSNFYVSRVIGFIANLTRRYTSRVDHLEWRVARHIYQGYGACYILTENFFDHFSKLDESVFLMGEELFLTLQLESVGSSVYYDPRLQIRHVDHSSVGKLPSRAFWEISKHSHKVYRRKVSPFASKAKS